MNIIDTPNGPIHVTPGSCIGLAVPAGWFPGPGQLREMAGKAPPKDGLPRKFLCPDCGHWRGSER